MQNASSNPYLRTKILTASPEELRLMLFDGAIKFSRLGKTALSNGDFESSYEALSRAKKIVMELSTSLNHEVDPEVCQQMAGVYTFIYKLLMNANMDRVVEPIDEALKLLEYERETWQLVLDKVETERDGKVVATDPTATSKPAPAINPTLTEMAGAQQTAISTLSVNG